MKIELLQKEDLSQAIETQIVGLYAQLNPSKTNFTVKEVLQASNPVVFVVCKEGDTVCGMALMAYYTVVSGHRGMIEDVVVDENYRQKGIGRNLMLKLLECAKEKGLDEVFLFTGHHRQAAISMYTSLGFELRQSGLYNLRLR